MNGIVKQPFLIVDPPSVDALDLVRKVIDAIDFPWERISQWVKETDQGVIPIKWDESGEKMPNTVTGLYVGSENTIYLSTRYDWMSSLPFVLTHEIGHMIDDAYLDTKKRNALIALFHKHFDWTVLSHDEESMKHSEIWWNGGVEYPAKIYECFADEFVAAFAPTIWNGTFSEDAHQRYPRFIHWTNDVEAVRDIVLKEDKQEPKENDEVKIKYLRDVTKKHPHAKAIVRAINLGLMDLPKPRVFRPHKKVTRGELAEHLVRLYDKVEK